MRESIWGAKRQSQGTYGWAPQIVYLTAIVSLKMSRGKSLSRPPFFKFNLSPTRQIRLGYKRG